MAKTVEYGGYTIQSRPYYDANWNKWQIRIVISRESHQGIQTREFSSMILYATEEQADLHGISFGDHLIDGKVEGRSIADVQSSDRRATPRIRVQFRTEFADASKLEGIGNMLDLSLGGCRIESPVSVVPGFSLELRIHIPDLDWPIMIERASVQWASGLMFGVAFFRMTDLEEKRLGQVIQKLRKDQEV